MKLLNGIAISTLGLFISQASAATLDYRHEYKDESRVHADQIKISHRLPNNVGFMVKAKSKNEKDDFYQNGKANGSEGQLSYQYKVNNKINLTPAITINFNDKGTIYKTALKASYKFNDNVSSWLRYRYDTFNITDHAQDGPNKHMFWSNSNRHFHERQ